MINFLPWRQQKIKRQRRQYLLLLIFCLLSHTILLLLYYAMLQPKQRALTYKLNRQKFIQQQQRQSYQLYYRNKKYLTQALKNNTQQKKFIRQLKKIRSWKHYHVTITTITLHNSQISVKGIIPDQQQHNFLTSLKKSNSSWHVIKQNCQSNNNINLELNLD